MPARTCKEAPSTLVARIQQLIHDRTGRGIHALNVDISGREVRLSGNSSSYYNKQMATHVALEAIQEVIPLELVSLENEIQVS